MLSSGPIEDARWTITTVPKQLGYQACRGKIPMVLSASYGPFMAECRMPNYVPSYQ